MKHLYILLLFLTGLNISAQTVGIISNQTAAFNGLTLFSPNSSTQTYLVNNCGEIVNQWTSNYTPGASVYLLENGNLLRTGKIANADITFGGVGGKVELFDWDNNLLWEYTYSSNLISQHHDIYPLPNGNILLLAVTTLTELETIQAGRNPINILENKLFNEQIIELEPVGSNQANVVWEWNVKDHLIQDFDTSKDNFGSVENNPQLLDINFLNNNNGDANWLHINSIQYNELLDQIIFSSRRLSEIYIIDHSTNTNEAASHSGGLYGKGGDFLYRWGNPIAYGSGTQSDQKLFSQHYPHWIPSGLDDEGKIMVFNNGNSIGYSSLDIIDPIQIASGVYLFDSVNNYSPLDAEWSYQDPVQTDFFSSILSSGQRLPNGNTLICDGDSGYFFEIDTNSNKVWEYINPDTSTGILNQGDTPALNFVFRAKKFSLDYPAFTGRLLTPTNPIEGNPDISDCDLLSALEFTLEKVNIKFFPNPVIDHLTIDYKNSIQSIEIYTVFGQLLKKVTNTKSIEFGNLISGFYLVKITTDEGSITKKILKE